MSEKFWFLKNCDLFEQLSSEQIKQVESRCRIRKFPRKCPIYLPADRADGVLLLASGRVKICGFTPDGKQSILAFIEPGELFGELATIEQGQREEYAEAVDPSTVLLIPADEMQRLMQEYPNVTIGITKIIGMRRKRIERRLKYLLFHSNRDRLVHLLLELAEQYGRKTGERIALGIKLSHQDLANIIGSTRETVTVTLGELQTAGYISVGRKKIELLNAAAMAQSVDIEPPKLAPSEEQPSRTTSRTGAKFPLM